MSVVVTNFKSSAAVLITLTFISIHRGTEKLRCVCDSSQSVLNLLRYQAMYVFHVFTLSVAECSAHTVPLQRFSVTATRAGRVFTVAENKSVSSSSVCTLL